MRKTGSHQARAICLLGPLLAVGLGCKTVPATNDAGMRRCPEFSWQIARELGRLMGVETERGDTKIQFVPGGLSLNPAEYRNARSLSNPNGSFRSAESLAKLVDFVPVGGGFRGGTPRLSDVYGLVIGNAKATEPESPEGAMVHEVIAKAKAVYDGTKQTSFEPGCESCPGWRITPATPANWAEDSGPEVMFAVRLDSAEIGKRERCIPAQQFEIEMQVYVVHVDRPWMNPILFGLPGWTLAKAASVGVSQHEHDDPVSGLMPMYPVALIVARGISVRMPIEKGHSGKPRIESLLFSGETDPATGALRVSGLHLIAYVNHVIRPRPH